MNLGLPPRFSWWRFRVLQGSGETPQCGSSPWAPRSSATFGKHPQEQKPSLNDCCNTNARPVLPSSALRNPTFSLLSVYSLGWIIHWTLHVLCAASPWSDLWQSCATAPSPFASWLSTSEDRWKGEMEEINSLQGYTDDGHMNVSEKTPITIAPAHLLMLS